MEAPLQQSSWALQKHCGDEIDDIYIFRSIHSNSLSIEQCQMNFHCKSPIVVVKMEPLMVSYPCTVLVLYMFHMSIPDLEYSVTRKWDLIG